MSGANQRLIPANTTLLQPGSKYFRINDALSAQSQAVNTSAAQLSTQIVTLQGQVASLESQVATLRSDVAALQGQSTSFTAFVASFNYVQAEVSTGSIYLDQRTIYKRSFVPPSAVVGTPNTVATYAHGVANINYVVAIQAVVGQSQGTNLPLTFVQTAQQPMVNGLSVWADPTNIYFSVGNTIFTSYVVVATMWYTATDR